VINSNESGTTTRTPSIIDRVISLLMKTFYAVAMHFYAGTARQAVSFTPISYSVIGSRGIKNPCWGKIALP
jgi:hypothetical protein